MVPVTDLDVLHPPLGLTIRAGDLTLRPFADADLPEYAALMQQPIFADDGAEYVFPWYRADPATRVREAMRFQWRLRSTFSPEDWTLAFGIWAHGRLIGCQDAVAQDFARRRTISSGSWLTRDVQGRGYGKLMRQAMLVFAFDHLGARRAESAAAGANESSFAVSRACGYVENGTEVSSMFETPVLEQRFVLTPEAFQRPTVPVEVEGLTDDLRSLLGA